MHKLKRTMKDTSIFSSNAETTLFVNCREMCGDMVHARVDRNENWVRTHGAKGESEQSKHLQLLVRNSSSIGRVLAFQAKGCEFGTRLLLQGFI